MGRGVAVVLLLAATAAALAADEAPVGVVVEDVRCAADPEFGYSLYLPSAFTAERRWPVVFAFSPGGRGSDPVRLLAPAAERLGYLLVGSNEARNGPWEPVAAAQRALWREVERRFPVDRRRCYATGFSGGARAAVEMALAHPGRFAGLVLCGAVFSPRVPFPAGGGLAVVGLVGDGDLNLEEHLRSERQLEDLGYARYQEVFAGPHRWPDAALYGEALDLLEVDAVRRGLAPRDDALVAAAAGRRLERARRHEAEGRPLLALHACRELARFFPGGETAREAGSLAAALAARPEVRAAEAAEAQYLADLRALNDWREYPPFRAAAERMRQRVAAGGPLGERARSCLHLESIFLARTGSDLLAGGEVEDAVQALTIAAGLYPPNAVACYNAACALARAGDPARAMAMLQGAARGRFADLDLLERDPDLASLRPLDGWAAVRAAVAANREQGLEPLRYDFGGP